MAKVVVDLLELVEVERKEGQRPTVPGHRVELPGELLLKRAVVSESREVIKQRNGTFRFVEATQVSSRGFQRPRRRQDPPAHPENYHP